MTKEQREKKGTAPIRVKNELEVREGKALERYQDFLEREKVTMTPEQHQESIRGVWPPLRRIIEDAVVAGRPVKIESKRKTKVVGKDDPEAVGREGMAPFVWQSPMLTITITVDVGDEVVGPRG